MSGAGGNLETIRFPVAGMTCGSCVVHITKAIRPLAGVEAVKVDLRHEMVTVRRAPALVSREALAAALTDAGYVPELDSASVISDPVRRGWLARLRGES